jgi:hypothetical protein
MRDQLSPVSRLRQGEEAMPGLPWRQYFQIKGLHNVQDKEL